MGAHFLLGEVPLYQACLQIGQRFSYVGRFHLETGIIYKLSSRSFNSLFSDRTPFDTFLSASYRKMTSLFSDVFLYIILFLSIIFCFLGRGHFYATIHRIMTTSCSSHEVGALSSIIKCTMLTIQKSLFPCHVHERCFSVIVFLVTANLSAKREQLQQCEGL